MYVDTPYIVNEGAVMKVQSSGSEAAGRERPFMAGHCRPTGSIVGPQFTALRPFKPT
jgi:hypothetical protein